MQLKKIHLFVLFIAVNLIEDFIAIFISGGEFTLAVISIMILVALAFSFIEDYVEHLYRIKNWIARRRMKKQWKKFARMKHSEARMQGKPVHARY